MKHKYKNNPHINTYLYTYKYTHTHTHTHTPAALKITASQQTLTVVTGFVTAKKLH